jgi:hypothetical protein
MKASGRERDERSRGGDCVRRSKSRSRNRRSRSRSRDSSKRSRYDNDRRSGNERRYEDDDRRNYGDRRNERDRSNRDMEGRWKDQERGKYRSDSQQSDSQPTPVVANIEPTSSIILKGLPFTTTTAEVTYLNAKYATLTVASHDCSLLRFWPSFFRNKSA